MFCVGFPVLARCYGWKRELDDEVLSMVVGFATRRVFSRVGTSWRVCVRAGGKMDSQQSFKLTSLNTQYI